ncbi:MAG: DnaA N-terminal domain-containing protein, partial [Chakrabartia sp.]
MPSILTPFQSDAAPAFNDDIFVVAWAAIRAGLRADIGARTFDHWLKPVDLIGYCDTDHVVRLSLPSEFMANWVSSHYTDRLTHAWRAMVPQVRSVRIETAGAAADRYIAPLVEEEVTVDPVASADT